MGFDYLSVLMAAGAAGVALCFTLALSWLRQRASGFLFVWAASIGIIVVSIALFSAFFTTGEAWQSSAAGVLLTLAYAVNYGGMTEFRDGTFKGRTVGVLALAGGLPIVIPALFGFDGLSFIAINLMSALLLALTGYHYWRIRAESPIPIGSIAALHFMLVLSYLLCVIVMAVETPLYLGGTVPDNWAEVLNLAVSVIAITGIGGLFITVHQERISRSHKAASLTDPLTGLSNRRALYERFASGKLAAGWGVIVFDLDDFKSHNDRHGHAFGDMVLQDFGIILQEHSRKDDMALRLGGEEFALVLHETNTSHALAIAERVRGVLGRRSYRVSDMAVTCTVSAGVAVAGNKDAGLDHLIRKADSALYAAKRAGRNRVSQISVTAA